MFFYIDKNNSKVYTLTSSYHKNDYEKKVAKISQILKRELEKFADKPEFDLIANYSNILNIMIFTGFFNEFVPIGTLITFIMLYFSYYV